MIVSSPPISSCIDALFQKHSPILSVNNNLRLPNIYCFHVSLWDWYGQLSSNILHPPNYRKQLASSWSSWWLNDISLAAHLVGTVWSLPCYGVCGMRKTVACSVNKACIPKTFPYRKITLFVNLWIAANWLPTPAALSPCSYFLFCLYSFKRSLLHTPGKLPVLL